jgi:hypothetical protein
MLFLRSALRALKTLISLHFISRAMAAGPILRVLSARILALSILGAVKPITGAVRETAPCTRQTTTCLCVCRRPAPETLSSCDLRVKCHALTIRLRFL